MRINSNDIMRSGPEVAEELRSLVHFSRASFWVPCHDRDCFPECGLSKRQRERAEAAFAAGRPFWDMVSACTIIPVGKGAFILSGLSRSVGPEESERWLPLIKAWIEKTIVERKARDQNVIMSGEVPQYLVNAAKCAINNRETLMALHLISKAGKVFNPASPDRPLHMLEMMFRKIAGGHAEAMHLELMGSGPQDIWIAFRNVPHALLSQGVNRLERWKPLKKMGIAKAFIHAFDSSTGRDIKDRIMSMEKTADLLGMPVFSETAMREIENRFNCSGARDILASIPKISGPRRFAAAFAGDLSPGSAEFNRDLYDCDGYYISSNGRCVLFLKKVRMKERERFDAVAWGGNIRKILGGAGEESYIPSPVGVAAAWQDTLDSRDVVGAAFWAFVHAFMLGKRDVVISDAVTWQLRGDELLAAGALKYACRAFRQALKLDCRSTDIWNSLGVSLARLGRNREAERAFRTAAHYNPSDFMAFYNLCGILHTRKEYDDAEKACLRALDIRSDDPRALLRLTRLLLDMGKNRDALGCVRKIPEDQRSVVPGAWRLFGTALYRNGRWNDAKRALEQALRSMPDDPMAMALLANGYASHEEDIVTAKKLVDNIVKKGVEQPEVSRILEKINHISVQSSLDKEKGDG